MFIEKKRRFPLWEALIALFIYLFHYTGLIDVTIRGASPLILLPLTVAVAMFYDEHVSLIFGAVCGMSIDAVAGSSACFNTLTFTLISFGIGLLAKRIFNRNLAGSIALTVIASVIYFGAKWLFFAIIPDVQGKVYYLFWHLTPSAVYTVIFILPFFYLEKALTKKTN
ncbi:MAG: rod shape-determining protein MreD [Clostridia bacterium]|nr:rod shape-determining protein MreD [Clostridia bacterium]